MKENTLPLDIIRYALLTSLICYLPYVAIAPWWLLLFVVTTLIYKLISAYYGLTRIPKGILVILIPSLLIVLKMYYGSMISSNFYIGFLLTFIGLKITELYSERDLKVLVFCNFYLIFAVLILIHELWIILYLIIALLANFSLMLKVTAPQASLRQIGSKSFKQILMAMPLSLLLFYTFPRLAAPLWQVPAQGQARIGFSDKMTPGSIAQLFHDERTAFRVTFKNQPILNGYWRGILLNFYNGVSWSSILYNSNPFRPLLPLADNTEADYEILLEPHQQQWLFYTKYPSASNPKLLFSPSYGLVNENKTIITQRFAYVIQSQKMPYHPLSKQEWMQNTQLPRASNPQLPVWAKQHYAQLNQQPKAFINFLHQHINQQPFWYTLSPPVLHSANQMDEFWFDTRKGYCEQYASAVTIILRSVNIPARVVMGYIGGQWNPIAHYLTLQQNDAHAWVEYWEEGIGWQELDPTSFIAPQRIEQSILDHRNEQLNQTDYLGSYQLSWLQQSTLLLESARFFAERWLLFYNQATQLNLLANLGLSRWDMNQLAQAAMGFIILFIILMGLWYQWRQKQSVDPLLIQYHLLQRELKRFNVAISPSTTLKQQCQSLVKNAPMLSGLVTLFLSRYEQLRLIRPNGSSQENNKQTQKLFKEFRLKLKRSKSFRR